MRQKQTLLSLLLIMGIACQAPAAFAVEWNPVDWLPSEAEKAEKRAEKAEQEAWEAKQRAAAAQREAKARQESAEQARQEAAARKEAKASKKLKVVDPTETAVKKQSIPQPEAPVAEAEPQETESKKEEAVRDLNENHFQKQASHKKVETDKRANATQENKGSVWNPMSWFGGNAESSKTESVKENKAQTAAATPATDGAKEEPRAMLMQESKKDKTHALQLPEGIKEEDARYYEDAKSMRGAVIETQRGNITIELYPEAAPITVTNFVKLTEQGFYNQLGMKFHRVVPEFVVQTGDPTGTGAGGSKDRIPLEVRNRLSHDNRGVVAMARGASANSASSQFYITLAPQKTLDAKYAIFGKVIQGYSVLEKITKDDRLYGVKMIDTKTITNREDPNETTKQSFLKKIF